MRAQAQTPAYAAVRRRHKASARNLGELVRWHRARRARYWGLWRVRVQGLLTAVVVHVQQLVSLARQVVPDPGGGVRVRVGAVG